MIQLVSKQPNDVNQTKYGMTKEVNFTIILLKNGIEMCSIRNEEKSLVAERLNQNSKD